MVFCSNCGFENSEDAKFCYQCGKEMNPTRYIGRVRKSEKKSSSDTLMNIVLIIVIVIFTIFIISLIFMYSFFGPIFHSFFG